MATIEWVEPAPLWEGRKLENIRLPRLLEFQSDDFMAEFLGALANQTATAPAAAYLKMHTLDSDKTGLKLYQPLHGCFYLVTASLVCRQLGLPDKSVARKQGQRTTFVIRRHNTVTGAGGKSVQREEGWVDEGVNKGWQPLIDDKGRSVAVRDDEERFPLHPVTVCTQTADSSGRLHCCERTLYHGYIATGNREKYIQKLAPAKANTGPTAILSNYLNELKAATDTLPAGAPDKNFDFRVDEFDSRVIAAWQALRAADAAQADQGAVDAGRIHESSLYILLDLADNLERILPTLWQAILANDINQLNGKPQSQKLFSLLTNTKLLNEAGSGDDVALAQALRDLKDKIGLVRGEEIALPTTIYNLIQLAPQDENGNNLSADQFVGVGAGVTPTPPAVPSTLKQYVAAGLPEEPQPMTPTAELASLLKDQIKIEAVDATGKEAAYFLRLVYDYDPLCPPVVSQGSQPFRFAKFFEPDAPARHIRLELPSIKMSDLRKYKKGVGLQMSPELRDVMNRIHKGMADGEPLLPAGSNWALGMICSFSIQIIFLVAFIVMFIFLIMLNIVFWWLAFLKICFPIPVKTGA